MVELLGIANDPDVSFSKLTQVIGRDQALTLRMLAVANSPYYGCSRRIDSTRSAIAVLGTRQVQNIASAMALAPAFDNAHGPRLWQHGLTAAVWTKHIVRAMGVPPLDYVFTAGILHDIGVVLLLNNAPAAESACLAEALSTGRPLQEVEREHLETDHAHIGARACSGWKLPERLAELVADHHADHDEAALDLRVLRAANALAHVCESPTDALTDEQRSPVEHALGRLDVAGDELDRLLEIRGDVVAEATAFG